MAYAYGDKILDDHYNAFVTNATAPYGINHIIGVGDGAYGLGQTEISDLAVAGETITATKWNSLFTAMDTVASQVNSAISSTTARTAGDPVAIKAGLITDLASLASAVAGGSVNASTGVTAASADVTNTASQVYDQKHVSECSFTFLGGDEARWFFNAGGRLRVVVTNTATNSTPKDNLIQGLIDQTGNFDLRATTSTISGTPVDSTTGSDLNIGYYDLTTTYQTIHTITESTSTYSATYDGQMTLTIEAKTNTVDATDGRNNNGTVVTIRVTTEVDDGVYTDYSPTNLAGTPVEIESAGPTNHLFSTVDPNTTYLTTAYDNVSVVSVSNTTTDSGT
jgi:hypothetical protein